MISSFVAALLAVLGSIFGAVGVKIYERSVSVERRSVSVGGMYVRLTGHDYNEFTRLHTDKDAYFTSYAFTNTSSKSIVGKPIRFEVLKDAYFIPEDNSISGPYIAVDAGASKQSQVALEADGSLAVVTINRLPPGGIFYIFIAASFPHFASFASEADDLKIEQQGFWSTPETRRRYRRLAIIAATALVGMAISSALAITAIQRAETAEAKSSSAR